MYSVFALECRQGQGDVVFTKFPRVVKWDPSKVHHYAVSVDRPANRVELSCFECQTTLDLQVSGIEAVKRTLAADDEVQVVSWIEIDEQ